MWLFCIASPVYQVAKRWNKMSDEDKEEYVAMYEKDKKRYVRYP